MSRSRLADCANAENQRFGQNVFITLVLQRGTRLLSRGRADTLHHFQGALNFFAQPAGNGRDQREDDRLAARGDELLQRIFRHVVQRRDEPLSRAQHDRLFAQA